MVTLLSTTCPQGFLPAPKRLYHLDGQGLIKHFTFLPYLSQNGNIRVTPFRRDTSHIPVQILQSRVGWVDCACRLPHIFSIITFWFTPQNLRICSIVVEKNVMNKPVQIMKYLLAP